MPSRGPHILKAVFLCSLCALVLSGCAFSRGDLGTPLKPEDIAAIKRGETTEAQVVALLGAPDQLIGMHRGMVTNYFYEDARYFRVNLGWPLGFISPISYAPHDLVFANSASGADTFQVAFDAEGAVRYAGFFRGAASARYRVVPFDAPKP